MKPNDNILYQVKGKDTYGYIVGKRRDGKMLFEPKGDGEIYAVSKDQLEEVVPYTVHIKSDGGYGGHVECDEGKYAVDDVVIVKTSNGPIIGIVTKTDTKMKGAADGNNIIGKVAFVETVVDEAMAAVAARKVSETVSIPKESVAPVAQPETD